MQIFDRRPAVRPVLQDPTTPTPQPLTGITQHRFSHHPLSFALENQPNAHPLTSLKKAGQTVIAAVAAVFAFIDEVNDSMNKARAASSRFSGSQW
jgi:hypothetical protein